mmetsp:Transcript_19408/g.68727  ORF Transcript_19408/g.68727 Transcript_19408/m.68727 type:complete len:323 (-) Transcript_19408:1981-2949(-)
MVPSVCLKRERRSAPGGKYVMGSREGPPPAPPLADDECDELSESRSYSVASLVSSPPMLMMLMRGAGGLICSSGRLPPPGATALTLRGDVPPTLVKLTPLADRARTPAGRCSSVLMRRCSCIGVNAPSSPENGLISAPPLGLRPRPGLPSRSSDEGGVPAPISPASRAEYLADWLLIDRLSRTMISSALPPPCGDGVPLPAASAPFAMAMAARLSRADDRRRCTDLRFVTTAPRWRFVFSNCSSRDMRPRCDARRRRRPSPRRRASDGCSYQLLRRGAASISWPCTTCLMKSAVPKTSLPSSRSLSTRSCSFTKSGRCLRGW